MDDIIELLLELAPYAKDMFAEMITPKKASDKAKHIISRSVSLVFWLSVIGGIVGIVGTFCHSQEKICRYLFIVPAGILTAMIAISYVYAICIIIVEVISKR